MKTLKEMVLSGELEYIVSMLVVSASLFTFAIGAKLEGKKTANIQCLNLTPTRWKQTWLRSKYLKRSELRSK